MRRSWTVTILKHEQPDERRWDDLVRFVEEWNRSGQPAVEAVLDFMFQVSFQETEQAQFDRFTEGLQQLGVAHTAASHGALEDADYGNADFVELWGTDVPMTPPLVLNEAQAFPAAPPCPRCGSQEALGPPPAAPLVVDETRLQTPDGPLDAAHLPNGERLVSRRFAAVLQDNVVQGYELHEVVDAATSAPSTTVFRLTARTRIVAPCTEHTKVSGDGFCPECGTAFGDVDGLRWVRSDEVGSDEVLTMHPTTSSLLYVSRRVLGLLEAAGLHGLHRGGILMVCRH